MRTLDVGVYFLIGTPDILLMCYSAYMERSTTNFFYELKKFFSQFNGLENWSVCLENYFLSLKKFSIAQTYSDCELLNFLKY